MNESNKSIDIIRLIEKSPAHRLTKSYQYRLINKMKNVFTSEEQQLFVGNFYCYLNHNPDEFIIDLDDIWKWIGFSNKHKAKELLCKHFIIDVDFMSIPGNTSKNNKGGRPSESITMTVKTFKRLCMRASTRKAGEIHECYIKLEQILDETINEESNELRNQLEESHQDKMMVQSKLRATEKNLQKEKQKKDWLLNRRHQDARRGDIVYLYQDNKENPESRFKVGKSKNIAQRELDYSNMSKCGEIVYIKYCLNCDLTEKAIHHMLDRYRIIRNQEWFIVKKELAIDVINKAVECLDGKTNDPSTIPKDDKISDDIMVVDTIIQDVPDILNSTTPSAHVDENILINTIEIMDIKENILPLLSTTPSELPAPSSTSTPLNPILFTDGRNFDKFVADCCDVGEQLVSHKSKLRQAHRVWCKGHVTPEIVKEFSNYLATRFKSGVVFENDVKHNCFRGVSIRPLTVIVGDKTDYQQFISQKCRIDYSYRISFTDFFTYFIDWKHETQPDFVLTTAYRLEIKTFLETVFAGGRVFESGTTKSSFLFGIWGLGVESNNFGMKRDPIRQSKKLSQYDATTQEKLKTWDSMSIASRELNIALSTLSYAVRFPRRVGDHFYRFEV